MKNGAEWKTIHMANSEQAAKRAEEILTREGVLVRLTPVYRGVSGEDNYYEVRVLPAEAEEARVLLLDNGIV